MRGTLWWCVVSLLGAVACGDDDGAVPDAGGDAGTGDASADGDVPADGGTLDPLRYLPAFAPGSRLEVRAHGSGGEPVLLRTFYDTEREHECRFGHATDGSIRCLPAWDFDTIATRYLDDECTEAVYGPTRGECDTPSYHVVRGDEQTRDCNFGPEQQVFRLTPTDVPSGSVWQRSEATGECEETSFDYATAFTGTVVPPDEFVEAAWMTDAAPGALGVAWLAAEDGAREVRSIYDGRYEITCARSTIDGEERCLHGPQARVESFWFADDACTEPHGWRIYSPPTCPSPPFAQVFGTYQETLGPLAELGAPLASDATVYRVGSCEATAVSDQIWTIQPVEGPAALSELLPVTRTPHGSGDVVPYFDVGADGTLFRPGVAWDTSRETPCSPRRMGDGALRCVPTEWTNALYYADDECTEGLVGHVASQPPPAYALVEETDLCIFYSEGQVVLAAYEVGEEWTEEGPIYRDDFGSCVVEERSETEVYYRRGDDIANALPLLEDVVSSL